MADDIRLALEFAQARPDDAARILEVHEPALVAGFLQRAPVRLASGVLASMLPIHTARCLAALPAQTAAALLREADILRAAAILRSIDTERRKTVLSAMPTAKAAACELILRHGSTEVGAWLDPRAPVLSDEGDVGDALRRLRHSEPGSGTMIFVLDRDTRVRGSAGWSDLITADHNLPLVRLMRPVVHVLPARAGLSGIADHLGWQDADVLPVVDRRERFIGALAHVELRRGLRELGEIASAREAEGGLIELAEAYWGALAGLLQTTVAAPSVERSDRGNRRHA